jgi:hypothetical protein
MERRVVIWNVVSKVINRKTREKEEYRDYDFVGAESRAGFRSRPVHTGTGTGLDGRKCWVTSESSARLLELEVVC